MRPTVMPTASLRQSGVAKTGKGTIKDNGGDMSIRWSSPTEYYEVPPNQILVRK